MLGFFKRKPAEIPPTAIPERIAIGNFSLSATLAGSSGRSVQMAGYIYSDDDEKALNARLDLYNRVVERQRIQSEIPELIAKREQMVKGIEQARDILGELTTKQDTAGGLSSHERMNLKNLSVNIQKMTEEIDKGDEAIAEAKRKAA